MNARFDAWRPSWRALVPFLPTAGLLALKQALQCDDHRLIQGAITFPYGCSHGISTRPVEAACALGFCGWMGHDYQTIGQVENYFSRVCRRAFNSISTCKSFIGWFDNTPRDEMRALLLPEVVLALEGRNDG